MEAVVNIIIGLVISTIANHFLLEVALGFTMSLGVNVLISSVFTVISLVRSYTIRRLFNGKSVWSAIRTRLGPQPLSNSEWAEYMALVYKDRLRMLPSDWNRLDAFRERYYTKGSKT